MSGSIKEAAVDSRRSFMVRIWCGKPGRHQNRSGKPLADEIANGTDEA
jgi:hypothetical protein